MILADHQFHFVACPGGAAVVNRAPSDLGPLGFHPHAFAILAARSACFLPDITTPIRIVLRESFEHDPKHNVRARA